ncbi:AMP dependent CoA ligase [Penicillium longicatenatum]|uniref:AMP dependent CoA ligase n=1 Tax=Penicillium longicatenatum TaxID=1561947 RepID=UPI0025472BFE|nr:AMP dependent CoA ligase [Penicillium longicatenatum]KAJ5650412.1 AMP dependent CoA ligase [Penicillium longicatenatum]
MALYRSPVIPIHDATDLSIAQFMTQYNPDDVPASKVVHVETFSNDAITYGSLREQAGRAAWGLQAKLGLQPGDTLLALVNNSNAFVLLAHATWWTGAIFAPLNTSATQGDILHVLKIVKPTHVVTIEEKLSTVQAAIASLSMTSKVLTIRCKVDNLLQFPDDIIGKTATESIPPYDLQGKSSKDVPSTICFSSGTTGKMKGVQLSHYNLVMNSIIMRASMPVRVNSNVREVFFAPYCHCYGLTLVVLSGMWVGAQYCSLPAFDLETFCRKSSELKVTDLHLVPPVALLLATSPVAQKYDLASLKRIVISAAPLKKSVQLLLKKRLPHVSVCQGYGLSECSGGVIHEIDEDEQAFGCVGKLFAGIEGRLVDPKSNKDVPLGEEGELWLRGPLVMMGYVNDKDATAKTFSDDGWIKSGDILKMDENQNFWVTDRLKEMIKYKGFQVAPSELEDILLRHPDVIDAAVCAVYDDAQATEVPLAYVSLSPEKAELSGSEKQKVLDTIKVWIDGQLAGYKKLRGGVFHLQSLPKTPTGKILRRLLPAKLNEEREAKL